MDGIEFKETYLSNDYLVSRNGEVYSLRNKLYLKFCLNNRGYRTVRLYVNKKRIQIAVHRLVGIAFLDKSTDDKTDINHIDGNKLNNNVSNLEWTNDSLNGRHAYRLGLKDRKKIQGENNVTSKLTDEQVLEIRRKRKEGVLYRELAEEYKISIGHVCNITREVVWKHLT